MSLDYDLSGIPARELLDWSITEQLIWATMLVGIGVITEKNADEFYARLIASERIRKRDYGISTKDVRDHIGLRTNVFPVETRTKWLKRVLSSEIDEIAHRFRGWAKGELNESATLLHQGQDEWPTDSFVEERMTR